MIKWESSVSSDGSNLMIPPQCWRAAASTRGLKVRQRYNKRDVPHAGD